MTEYREEYLRLQRMDELSRADGIVQTMVNDHIEPFTRETYIDLMGWDEIPDPWTFELESTLPPIFCDFEKVEVLD